MRTFHLLISAILIVSGCNREDKKSIEQHTGKVNPVNCLTGVDPFGRSFSSIASLNEKKQVGLFFWLWIGQPYATDIYDATRILALPDGLNILTGKDVPVSPNGQAHFWGEPIWQYYNSEDEWVIRKQIQMLTLAGIDFIYFDTTNALIYKNVFMKILSVINEYQEKGWNPPRVVFYTHSRSIRTTESIYRELYEPGHFPTTWYRINGKPMIISYTKVEDDIAEAKSRGDNNYSPEPLPDEIRNFFHILKPQWPGDPVFENGFPWVEWIYPQPLHTNVMNVTVASHPSVPMSFSLTRGLVNWGRGWNPDLSKNVSEDVDKGTFFQRQWDHAIKTNPDMISIGGWNEWIAYKQLWDGEYMMCDAVNKEYSRDIEPMNGGYQDAFYIQMIQNIRRYKGIGRQEQKKTGKKTVNIHGNISQWDNVYYSLKNIGCDDIGRNNQGAAPTVHYEQQVPENILQEIKVSDDEEYIYFYIRGNKPFAVESGNNVLNILIGTGEPGLRDWECYEYIIGRDYTDNMTDINRIGKDFSVEATGNADFVSNNDVIQIRIQRKAVGLDKKDRFYFKIASGVEVSSDIMSYYTSGSVMPMGRLSYMYEMN